MTISGRPKALLVLDDEERARLESWARWAVINRSTDQLGLISLDGRVIAPRPNRGWRGTSNAGGEGRR